MEDCSFRILNQTPNGKIFKCLTCNKIQIEYKNLNFNFEKGEFEFFRKYFINLDPEHWENINKESIYTRKILIPIGHRNFTAMFNVEEVYEIKSMLYGMYKNNNKAELISHYELGAKVNLN